MSKNRHSSSLRRNTGKKRSGKTIETGRKALPSLCLFDLPSFIPFFCVWNHMWKRVRPATYDRIAVIFFFLFFLPILSPQALQGFTYAEPTRREDGLCFLSSTTWYIQHAKVTLSRLLNTTSWAHTHMCACEYWDVDSLGCGISDMGVGNWFGQLYHFVCNSYLMAY